MCKVEIEKVVNGYTAQYKGQTYVFSSTEELFVSLLLAFEHRCEQLGGKGYGKVAIDREGKPDEQ